MPLLCCEQTFFPEADAATQLLESFVVFAGAFVMRPVGGVLFGYIGDKFGRVYSMRLAMSLMALPTTAIAILPGYATLGILSTILLAVIRLIQGLSVGGAFGALMTYAMEVTPPNRVGFVSALLKVFSAAGTLVGSLVAALMHAIYTEAELLEWAWRLPFALGIGVSLVGTAQARLPPPLTSPYKLRSSCGRQASGCAAVCERQRSSKRPRRQVS